jgi:hypothetical protein
MTLQRGFSLSAGAAAGLAALVMAWPPASRAASWDAAQFKQFGGTYSGDCRNPAALFLRITEKTLVAERAHQRIEGRITDSAVSFLGPSPPPAFQTALLTDLPGGRELSVLVMRDTSGRFLSLQADAKTLAELGLRPNDRTAYRDCDGTRRAADGAAARKERDGQAQDARATAAAHPLADPAFAAAYRKTLGTRLNQRWLARMEGPNIEMAPVRIAGQRYTVHAFCKPRDCGDNNMVFLYAADTRRAHALLFEGGRNQVLLGAPSPAVGAELRRLWRTAWRQAS